MHTYDLRIHGHADSAKVILELLLLEDSTCALAWFELCRTTQHMGMANPGELNETLKVVLEMINQAIIYDPGNAYYLSYRGSLETFQFYIAIQTGNEKAREYLVKLKDTYKFVFKLDPSYYEDKITLVEFFGGLPLEMGGDPDNRLKNRCLSFAAAELI